MLVVEENGNKMHNIAWDKAANDGGVYDDLLTFSR